MLPCVSIGLRSLYTMRLLYPRHWLGYRSTAGRISAKAWHVGYRRLSTSTSLDSSVKNRNSGGKGFILGISALCATAASGYMFYDALNIPPCVKAAIAEIRTNNTIREHLGDRITLRSDWTVEERGDRAVVRVNASGSKSGGMFTCLLSRSETGWNIVTVDMIYNEARPATDTLNSAPVYDALEKAGAK